MKKVICAFGTRPEAIKMAPLVHALRAEKDIELIVAVTAQHREMLDQVLSLFEITPEYDLDIMSAGQSLTDILTRVMYGMDEIFEKEKPDMVLVHGDTSTTLGTSMAAFYRRVPVGHVEAGLRTGNKYSPFPEEINRRITGVIADVNFAPTEVNRRNLLRENTPDSSIVITGNTVIDALLMTVDKHCELEGELADIDYENRRVLLMTCHRRENWGKPMQEIFQAVRDSLLAHPDTELVFPVHLNPLVRSLAHEVFDGIERAHLVEPQDYLPFAVLMNKCHLILSDSGGIQEEAPALGKPVLVLRDTTERPEAVEAGTVRLAGNTYDSVSRSLELLLTDDEEYRAMSVAKNPYGDGNASVRTVEGIKAFFGL